MTIRNAVLQAMEEVLGLPSAELEQNPDMDLIENGLLDSLGIVALINYLSTLTRHNIDIRQLKPHDFTSVNTFCAALDTLK